jgi:predicted DNA-binding transcriptional regulator AlpA
MADSTLLVSAAWERLSQILEAVAEKLSAPPVENRLLTPGELAEFLKIDEETLRRWRQTGGGPRYLNLHGDKGAVRYRWSEVESWLKSRERSSSWETPSTPKRRA